MTELSKELQAAVNRFTAGRAIEVNDILLMYKAIAVLEVYEDAVFKIGDAIDPYRKPFYSETPDTAPSDVYKRMHTEIVAEIVRIKDIQGQVPFYECEGFRYED